EQAHASGFTRHERAPDVPHRLALSGHLARRLDRRLLGGRQLVHRDALEIAFDHVHCHLSPPVNGRRSERPDRPAPARATWRRHPSGGPDYSDCGNTGSSRHRPSMCFPYHRPLMRLRLLTALLLLLVSAAGAAGPVVIEDWTRIPVGTRGIPEGWK